MTRDGFAAPGAPVAAVSYPLNSQLEVFVVGADGVLNLFWKANNGAWNQPFPLTGRVCAPAFTPVAAAYYPLNNQLEVFFVDGNGVFRVVWKEQNGTWKDPFPLTSPGFASPGTPLAAVYYVPNNQLEVFHIDGHGVLKVVWKEQNGAWKQPFPLTEPGFAPAGAPLSAVYYPVNNQLEVFSVNAQGALVLKWKAQNGQLTPPSC